MSKGDFRKMSGLRFCHFVKLESSIEGNRSMWRFNRCVRVFWYAILGIVFVASSATAFSEDLAKRSTDPIREMRARMNAQLALARQQFMPRLSAADRKRLVLDRYVLDRYAIGTVPIYGIAPAGNIYSIASINYANARLLHAEAYSRELDNWLKQVEIAWDRRKVYEVKRMEVDYIRQLRRSEYLNDQKWTNSREWERLKNHPELSREKITSGDALNFLLNKLSTGLLPYEFDSRDPEYMEAVPKWLGIEPSELKYINLKVDAFTFAASDAGDAEGIQWPQILRWNEFDTVRKEFEGQRDVVRGLSQTAEPIPPAAIDTLSQLLVDLERILLEDDNVKRKIAIRRLYTDQHRCRLLIKRLRDEVNAAGETGRMHPHIRYEPNVDGENLISLLTFMSRNGVRFTRANAGASAAYFALYQKMRTLCVNAEESVASYAPILVEDVR